MTSMQELVASGLRHLLILVNAINTPPQPTVPPYLIFTCIIVQTASAQGNEGEGATATATSTAASTATSTIPAAAAA